MTDVTVPGGDGSVFSFDVGDPIIPDDNEAASFAAEDVLELDYAAPQDVNTANISDASAQAVPGDYNELIDNEAGSYMVPAGWTYLAASVVDPRDDPYYGFLATGDLTGSVANFSATGSIYTAGAGQQDIIAPDYMTIDTSSSAGGSTGGFIVAQSLDTLQLDSGDWNVLLDGYVGDSVFLGSGDSTVSAGIGSVIVGGTGTATVTLGQGIFVGGAGVSTVDMQGTADAAFGGTGATTVTENGADDDVSGGSGPATVVLNGTSDAVFAGAGATTVFAGGTSSTVDAGAGALVVVNSGTGTSYFDGTGAYPGVPENQGTATFFGDTAGAYLFTEDKQLYLVSGGGADTVAAIYNADVIGPQVAPVIFGAAGCDITITEEANGIFATAEAGNETINAGQSFNPGMVFFAGTGNDDLIGFNGGGNYFLASTGNATMTGGNGTLGPYGGDLYEFANGHAGGTDVISTFGPGSALFLSGYGTAADSGISSETATTAGVQLDLTDGTKIIFSSLTSTSALSGSIFHI